MHVPKVVATLAWLTKVNKHMNNADRNQMAQEFLEHLCPEELKPAFIKCLETNDAAGAERIVDQVMKDLA